MLSPDHLASLDRRLRRWLTYLPPSVPIRLYSAGRRHFLGGFAEQPPRHAVKPPPALHRTLWGLEFRSPLMNAAGMFKKGEGHDVVAAQGAGAYVAGTSTWSPRTGNVRHGIATPFVPYPRSGAASNWLGLPNPGHQLVARRLAAVVRQAGCPVGASLAADSGPEAPRDPLDGLIRGLDCYAEAGVDFLELNESCPNTEDDQEADSEAFGAFAERLRQVSDRFLRHRSRSLPVLVKLSTDTELERLPKLLDLLLELGFDGLVLGNTSTAYRRLREHIHAAEKRLYDRFSDDFGGGVSGRPLKDPSLQLTRAAAGHLASRRPAGEFHLVRVGGIENASDVRASLEAGASLVQWYTGYFEAFSRRGHRLYGDLYRNLVRS